MKSNKYLHEFQRTFDIMEDCFLDGLMLLADIPQELHEQAIQSCEHCLSSLARDFETFKREVLHINEFGQKISLEGQCNNMSIFELMKELKRGFSLVRSDLFTEYEVLPHALSHLEKWGECMEQLEKQLTITAGGNYAQK
ncbi:hypothetical protein [Legionella sp.]|uniref:hypothetical protein n=1 Tax=Legionella sp. TaxID=459 RepID=UPI00321FB8AC